MLCTPYAPRIRIPEILERGRGQTTELMIYRDGAQVVPTSATYSLIRPDNIYVIEDVVAAISGGGTLSYAHSAGQLGTSLNLGEGYIQEWSVTISGEVFEFRRMVSLVLKRLYPVITDLDLTSTYSDLEAIRPSSLSSYQKYIDEAWFTIINRLRTESSGYEYLVLSPVSLRAPHLELTLFYIFRDFHSSMGQTSGRYLDLADMHRKSYKAAWDAVNWIYDETHDGRAGDADVRKSRRPTIFLNGTPATRYRYRR